MKSTEERKEQLKHLIKRKERIRAKHLLSIKKHLADVKICEDYIKKHQTELEALQSVKNC